MSMMLVGAPLGVIVGYLMAAVLQSYATWKLAFEIQGIISFAYFFVFTVIPSRYLEINKIQLAKKMEDLKRCSYKGKRNQIQQLRAEANVPEVGGTGERYSSTHARYESQIPSLIHNALASRGAGAFVAKDNDGADADGYQRVLNDLSRDSSGMNVG